MAINELRAIAMFAKAVELGSLRRAAAAQGVSPQAASQALAQLEEHLGVRLLHRTTRAIALTDEGRQFLEATQPAIAALDRALQRVRNAKDDIAGPLRIVGPQSVFVPVVWPLIDEFCAAHPGVQPDVQLDDRIGDWVRERVDVGFRFGTSAEEGVIARRLFSLQLIVCATPDYLARHGAPRSVDELALHRCCVFRHPVNGRLLPWELSVDGQRVQRDMAPAITTNDAEMEVRAVLSGQVIGQLTGISAAEPIRAGRLVPLLTAHVAEHLGVHVYYGSRSALPSRVRAFIDLAVARLGDSTRWALSAQELATAEARGRAVAA
ncbi:LysR family transcriptional regulator [Derxia lacustris]|uniref:LysR family transcriptional regulator n=1 Tax=Derxia lacustris TaxID=764842 RepID=UPI000A178146|nr:LysR family transcriptional regulator [Derxia lacustris]